ncbi:hypothetical protein GCM10010246_04250 [Streptomyces cuspidosporus]|uniref:Uncharacterized protein n=1 Tax=Streptomyces cuspidosporus TaxID=66882 RepID=A0ABN3FBB0_9ACTN
MSRVGADEFADALLSGAVRVTVGQLGESAAGLREADVHAMADRKVAQSLGDMCFPTPTGPQRMTDSPACNQRRAARIAAEGLGEAGIEGLRHAGQP